jgi:tetratricopeptide (TPR) repeat protein
MKRVLAWGGMLLFVAGLAACSRGPGELLADGRAAIAEIGKPLPDSVIVSAGITSLREFTTKFAEDAKADSAYYLLGTLYGATRQDADAGLTFMALIDNYPSSPLRAKALVLASQAFENVKRYGEARACMQTLMADYPTHEFVAGGSAKWLLMNIGKEPEQWQAQFGADSTSPSASRPVATRPAR